MFETSAPRILKNDQIKSILLHPEKTASTDIHRLRKKGRKGGRI
jgi:hypothetical protein